MNALHILFRTGRFNLSKVGEHFINPCCFGEDLAAWLRVKLVEKGVEARQPYQEDWLIDFQLALAVRAAPLRAGQSLTYANIIRGAKSA